MFDTFIVRTDCIIATEDLNAHPNVRSIISLPRGWLLYEFHHPLFQDPDFLDERAWREKMDKNPVVRQLRIEMLNNERALLAPWYAKKKKPGDADGFLANEVCHYRVCTLARMRWLIFEMPGSWGSATAFAVTLFTSDAVKPSPIVTELIAEWTHSSKGQLQSSDPEPTPGGFMLKAKCKRTGHWLAALWVLFSDARWKTGITKMSLTLASV